MAIPFDLIRLCIIIYTLSANCVESPYQWDRFVSQLVEIYVNVNIWPQTIFESPLTTLWQRVKVDQVNLLVWECWFPHFPDRQCGPFFLSHSVVSRHCIDLTILNQSGNHANQYPACNHWRYCLVLRCWVSQREISITTSVSQGII